jgi:FMN phosphatase YigB (HAD superfamily)
MRAQGISLLVTDVDNTLYDWLDIWYSSFNALLDETVRISGVSREVLEHQMRAIHQRAGTAEYFHVLQELPALRDLHGTSGYIDLYQPAIAEFRSARARAMRLYPGVRETLVAIREHGTRIVAYTESQSFYTSLRFRWLELDGLIDVLYSPAESKHAPEVNLLGIRQYPDEHYLLRETEHRHTPAGHYKPDTEVLKSIVEEFGESMRSTLYVGDSLLKDVAMAQALGVCDAHAAYGVAQSRTEYELLRRVSHWTDEDVARERAMLERPVVKPTVALSEFGDLLDVFSFRGFVTRL